MASLTSLVVSPSMVISFIKAVEIRSHLKIAGVYNVPGDLDVKLFKRREKNRKKERKERKGIKGKEKKE